MLLTLFQLFRLLISYLPIIIDVILHIVNLCITTNVFPLSCKSYIVTPLIKKPGLDAEILKNYRPVSNLSFLSKVIEKVIASRIISHIENNAIIDKFQSAYKCGHNTETALLRVHSDYYWQMKWIISSSSRFICCF